MSTPITRNPAGKYVAIDFVDARDSHPIIRPGERFDVADDELAKWLIETGAVRLAGAPAFTCLPGGSA